MNFNQLEAFISIAKYRSFSKAAESLYLSQPAVSVHIRALEAELDVRLVLRSTRGVALTNEGVAFFEYAQNIIALRDAALAELKKAPGTAGGTLSIAASTVPAQYILPAVLPSLHRRHPEVYPVIQQYDSGEVVRRIIRMDCEVGVTGATFSRGNCEYVPFLTEKLVVIAPNTPFYAGLGRSFRPAMFSSLPFVSREPGSGTRKQYESFFAASGIENKDLNVVAQVQGTEGIIQAVKNGLGISIVSSIAAESSVLDGGILAFALDSPLLTRNFYCVYRKKHQLSAAARAFTEHLTQYYAKTEGPSAGFGA